jgi:hypothetical protein
MNKTTTVLLKRHVMRTGPPETAIQRYKAARKQFKKLDRVTREKLISAMRRNQNEQ